MLKKLARTLGLATLLLSATTQALPIVQADAFSTGDNKAALETSTGLVWMDFGVNSNLSYAQVRDLLPTQFTGWRLATAAEADHLWSSIFGNLPEWNRFGQGFGYLNSLDQDDYFNSIFDIFGNNSDASFETRDADGNLLDSWVSKSLFGVFEKEPGITGFISAESPYDNVHANTAMYLEMNGVDVSDWFGTLLVKDSTTEVAEPGSLFLMLLATTGLVLRIRRARKNFR